MDFFQPIDPPERVTLFEVASKLPLIETTWKIDFHSQPRPWPENRQKKADLEKVGL